MNSGGAEHSPRSHDRWARGRRDGGLRRLASITKSIGIAAAVGSGLLALYLGRALPGRHTTAASGSAPAAQGAAAPGQATTPSAPTTNPSGSGSSGSVSPTAPPTTITPPTRPPARTITQPIVSSGAS